MENEFSFAENSSAIFAHKPLPALPPQENNDNTSRGFLPDYAIGPIDPSLSTSNSLATSSDPYSQHFEDTSHRGYSSSQTRISHSYPSPLSHLENTAVPPSGLTNEGPQVRHSRMARRKYSFDEKSSAFRKFECSIGAKAMPAYFQPPLPQQSHILKSLTRHIAQTYRDCNPEFMYETNRNPRRVLTKPSKGVKNEGYDNENSDYILYVNDILGIDSGHQYEVQDILGAGTFGQVARCTNLKTGEVVGVKVVKNKEAYFNQSVMEVKILEWLNEKFDPDDKHHILRLQGTFIHKRHLCLVFELLSVNLYELIKQNQFRGLSTNLVRVFTNQILDSLCVLKEARIIHCDLKPENILLKNLESATLKVIDFGSACHEQETVYTYIQSRFYRSPEIILGLPYTTSIDMWSLGCIAVELFLGLPLFPGSSEYNQLNRIVEMLGAPPPYMIEVGKSGFDFFERYIDAEGSRSYHLKSMEQYSQEHKTNEQPSKQYFSATTLPELIRSYPMPRKSMSKPEIDKEMKNREIFLDFVQGLLNMNPLERWSPHQAKLHPFLSGSKYTGHFVPPTMRGPDYSSGGINPLESNTGALRTSMQRKRETFPAMASDSLPFVTPNPRATLPLPIQEPNPPNLAGLLLKQNQPVGRARSNTIGSSQMRGDVPLQLQHYPGKGKRQENGLTAEYAGAIRSSADTQYLESIQGGNPQLNGQWNPGQYQRQGYPNDSSLTGGTRTIHEAPPAINTLPSGYSAYLPRRDIVASEIAHTELYSQPNEHYERTHNYSDPSENQRPFSITEQTTYGQIMANVENQRNSLYGVSGNMGGLNELMSSPRTSHRNLGTLAEAVNSGYVLPNSDTFISNDPMGRVDASGGIPPNYYHSNESHVTSSAELPREDNLASTHKRNSAYGGVKNDSRLYGSHPRYGENRKSYPVEPGYVPEIYNHVSQSHYPSTNPMDAHASSILSALTSDTGYHPSQGAPDLSNQQTRPADLEPAAHNYVGEGFSQQFTPRNKRQGLYMDNVYSSTGGSTKRGEYLGYSNPEHERIPTDYTRQLNRQGEGNFEEAVGNQLDNLTMNERRNHRRNSYDFSPVGRSDIPTGVRAPDVYQDTTFDSGPNYGTPYSSNIHYQSQRPNVYSQDEYGTPQSLYKSPTESLQSGAPPPSMVDISTPRYRTLYQETLGSSSVGPSQPSRLDTFQHQPSHHYSPKQGSPLTQSPRINGMMSASDESVYENRYNTTESNPNIRGSGNEAINRDIIEQLHPYISQRERTDQNYYPHGDTKFSINDSVDPVSYEYSGNRHPSARHSMSPRVPSPSNHVRENLPKDNRHSTHIPLEQPSYYVLDPNSLHLAHDSSERKQ